MAASILEDARRLASRGRHSAVISLLEPRLPLFRDSHRFYFLLGSSCLHSGDIGGATTYLRRAEQLEPHDQDTKLCLAALHLRRGESDKALAMYLAVLDEDPKDRTARRALALLRKPEAMDRSGSLADSGGLGSFMPPQRGLPRWIVPIGLVSVVAVATVLLFPLMEKSLRGLGDLRSPRPEIAAVSLSDSERARPVGSVGNSRYILTEKEALAAFDRAKARFQEYRDNAALVDINRIIDSNASTNLKEKARTLLAFVSVPDWRSLKDIPAFPEVKADPGLYRNTSVIWKGRAANMRGPATERSFDFLVGYADRQKLDGIVPVKVMDGGISIPVEAPFEMLARVVAEDGDLSLRAIAIHELSET
ncbi:MAG: tetratricopeptide repeat protein, partial [Spirochaetota bacterium]